MGIVIKVAAALGAYFVAVTFIDTGESFMLVGIMFLLAIHFTVSGLFDLWTEIESARTEKPEAE